MKTRNPKNRRFEKPKCELCNRTLRFRPSNPTVGKCLDCDYTYDLTPKPREAQRGERGVPSEGERSEPESGLPSDSDRGDLFKGILI